MNPTEPIPLNALLANQKFREQVFLEALLHARKQLKTPLVERLKALVNAKSLLLDGFSRSPFRIITTARVNELAQKLARATLLPDGEQIFDIIVSIWVEAHAELATSTREVCADQGIVLKPEPATRVSAAPHPGMMKRLIAAVRDRGAETDEDAIKLMLFTLTGLHDNIAAEHKPDEPATVPQRIAAEHRLEDTMGQFPTPPPTDRLDTSNIAPAWWDLLLEWLHRVPYESTLWEAEAIEPFRDRFAALVQEKQQLRSGRARIAEALVRLHVDLDDTIADLELDSISSWDAVHCPAHEIQPAQQQLEQLRAALSAWRDLGQMPKRRSERTIYLDEMQRLEEQIETLYASLTTMLVTVGASKGAPPPDEDEQKLEREELQDGGIAVAASDLVLESIGDTEDDPVVEGGAEVADTPVGDGEVQTRQACADARDGADGELVTEDRAVVATFMPELREDGAAVTWRDLSRSGIAQQVQQEGEAADHSPSEQLGVPEQPQPAVAQGSIETWQDLFWSLLAADDIGGAYWLARALVARDTTPPVALDLLQVLVGSYWLPIASDQGGVLTADIATIASRYQPFGRDEEVLLGLGAACIPVLRTPASGLLDWVEAPA